MTLTTWFFVLILQNAAFTWVSRARNSNSLPYHGAAALTSNGVWFISQLYLIGQVAKPDMPFEKLVAIGLVYVTGTTTGGLLMHYVSLRWLEKGKRKVGG